MYNVYSFKSYGISGCHVSIKVRNLKKKTYISNFNPGYIRKNLKKIDLKGLLKMNIESEIY